MKKNTLLLIAVLAVILIIISARTDFSAYSSSYRVNASLIEYNEDTDNTNKDFNLNLSPPGSRVKFSVSVKQDDLYFQIDGCRDLQVKIRKDTNIGLSRFVPLFKIPGFRSNIDFYWTGKMIVGNEVIDLHNEGLLTINGSYRIIGACSAKTTKKLIEDRIMEQTRKIIEENIRKEMGEQKSFATRINVTP